VGAAAVKPHLQKRLIAAHVPVKTSRLRSEFAIFEIGQKAVLKMNDLTVSKWFGIENNQKVSGC
jgi:hypothetical protein